MQHSLLAAIDLHAHSGPDSIERTIDSLQLARLACAHGMRAIVLKNHFEPTASQAYLVSQLVPQIRVFGGIALNLAIGGMNAYAVDHLARVSGGLGRIVWMGSVDTESQVRHDRSNRPFVSITEDGTLRRETCEVIDCIAKHDLVLATGHATPDEVFLLLHEGRRRGVRKMVVTHAMMAPIHMSVPQMQEAASAGAYIEFAYNGIIGPHKEFEPAQYAKAIQAIGPQQCILVSDLGQASNPTHPDGLLDFFQKLNRQGIGDNDIDWMARKNPARLLDLD